MLTLVEVLRGGRQCDEDGVEIIMSRQACVEAADFIEAAKLRELLLLAVIEKIKDFAQFQRHVACGTSKIGQVSSETQACLMDVAANIDKLLVKVPSQALREHEAKLLDKAGVVIVNELEGLASESAMKQVYQTTDRMAEERRKK